MQIINPNMSDGGSSSNNLKVYRVYPVCTGFNSSAELHCRISFYNSSQQLTTKDTKISVQINPGS
jgi:hypothetical protein